MAAHDVPQPNARRRLAASTVRLLLTLVGFGIAWSWSAGPAAARQVTPGVAPLTVSLTPPASAGTLTTLRDRPAGNAGNAE